LPSHIKSDPVQLVLFWNENKAQVVAHGIFYFNNEAVLPVCFSGSEALDTWHTELQRNAGDVYYFIVNEHSCKRYAYSNNSLQKHAFDPIRSLIYKLAPFEYKNSCDAGLKSTFVAQFRSLNLPSASVDVIQLKEQWNRLLSMAHLEGNTALEHEEVYRVFQEQTGLAFPKELKVMLSVCNGIETFLNGTEFLSGEQVLEEWKNWKAIYQSSNYMNLIDEYQYKSRSQKTVPMYVNPFRIPFIHDGGGNFIGIDMLPNSAGKIGQIIAFGVDESAIRYIASDMNDFIQQFLDGKNPMNNDKMTTTSVVC